MPELTNTDTYTDEREKVSDLVSHCTIFDSVATLSIVKLKTVPGKSNNERVSIDEIVTFDSIMENFLLRG